MYSELTTVVFCWRVDGRLTGAYGKVLPRGYMDKANEYSKERCGTGEAEVR